MLRCAVTPRPSPRQPWASGQFGILYSPPQFNPAVAIDLQMASHLWKWADSANNKRPVHHRALCLACCPIATGVLPLLALPGAA